MDQKTVKGKVKFNLYLWAKNCKRNTQNYYTFMSKKTLE